MKIIRVSRSQEIERIISIGNFPSIKMTTQKVDKLIRLLNLDLYFDSSVLDKDLLLLAISDNEQKIVGLPRWRLAIKYNISPARLNYQTLEFYGDAVLLMIVVDYFYQKYGLNISPFELTKLRRGSISNFKLTDYSRELGICKDIFGIPDTVSLDDHNICGDSIESILGALYLMVGLNSLSKIQNWYVNLPAVKADLEYQFGQIVQYNANTFIPSLKFSPDFTKSSLTNLTRFIDNYNKQYPNIKVQFSTDDILIFSDATRDLPIWKQNHSGNLTEQDADEIIEKLIDNNILIPLEADYTSIFEEATNPLEFLMASAASERYRGASETLPRFMRSRR